eukprot:CAMPEP_0198313806 /NCGR_PEP_ID=MMETSP1450-20131203/4704_1 /TAXON_ID=753684 ORGANISM="Madagascaria erythrocladiodes, Strain CCMP3234" /NCGR_SAMPLE_ID=MMETSP1450 /ASSEMBLY_ACC=CAM_ASM_001115 /LENGTH=90 /DNA_ID=CAMNT_0044016825 /DNA_START=59 /DNA_END=331 /DNA_ORIENTATION=-
MTPWKMASVARWVDHIVPKNDAHDAQELAAIIPILTAAMVQLSRDSPDVVDPVLSRRQLEKLDFDLRALGRSHPQYRTVLETTTIILSSA